MEAVNGQWTDGLLSGSFFEKAKEELGASWRSRLRKTHKNPVFSTLWNELEEIAAAAGSEPLPVLSFGLFRQYAESGGRLEYEQVYFERRGRLCASVLQAVVDPAFERIAVLEDMLWEICGEYTWCLPAHLPQDKQVRPAWEEVDLFASETAGMLAEVVLLLGDALNPVLADRIREEVQRRVLTPVFERGDSFGWLTACHNWAAVCGSGCGIAALLLMDGNKMRSKSAARMAEVMTSFLQGYAEDGGCSEGLGYWVYGFGYFVYFADLLHTFSSGRIDLLDTAKVRTIALFPDHIHLSRGTYVNYSDSSDHEIVPSGLLSRLAELDDRLTSVPLDLPRYRQDPCRRWAHLLRNLLWSRPSSNGGEPHKADYLADLSWLVCRYAERDQPIMPVLAFAAKGGHNGEFHNHNDLGHFILHGGGENLLVDLGAGEYSKDYFADGRDAILQISSEGHSVPLINGVAQRSGHTAAARVVEVSIQRNEAVMELDLTSAYPVEADLQRYHRRLEWKQGEGQAQLLLQDRFEFGTAPGQVEERLISLIRPAEEAGRLIWNGKNAYLTLNYPRDQWAVSVEECVTSAHDGSPMTVYRTKLLLQDKKQERKGSAGLEACLCELRLILSGYHSNKPAEARQRQHSRQPERRISRSRRG
ncbi:heparinase II/III family protein [Paenibacillus sp. JX-17]|uniref:Heparinase II/III family protein n=1 Tax=Paenibacillus lacisoli TaxID=3064525 RepID=A0ABT9CC64_9BACL|nr:heparinase II/III family protein [Paenibacillus sp. JX-17]MDO7906857.1 heparinase II/III family protein [Paenibacillus sp. JX-17]